MIGSAFPSLGGVLGHRQPPAVRRPVVALIAVPRELVPSNADGIEDAEVERLNDECEALRCENAQLRGDLAAAYCRMDDMEGLNDE
jgi:hypothetical protein